MIRPATEGIKQYVQAGFSTWPLRWAGDRWTVRVDDNNNPISDDGTPRSFIEAEIIGGTNQLRAFSTPGNRVFIQPGSVRFYIAVEELTGMTAAEEVADELSELMERVSITPLFALLDGDGNYVVSSDGYRVVGADTTMIIRTRDFSINHGVATMETGNYSVLMCTVPFDFTYHN
jgi:hypothetical protein